MALDLPLACVALAFVFVFFPTRILVMREQAKDPEGFDNKDPRDQHTRLGVAGKRALAAHNNAFEAFAPFAAAVLACEVRHANARLTTIFAIVHVACRFAYPWLYVWGIDKLRSGLWLLATLMTSALLLMAVIGYQ
jgi:uncharacterized MAPEG superfamily protein